MQHDPLVELYRQIDETEDAERQADARYDLEALGRHSEALGELCEVERYVEPRSDTGAVLKLRSVAKTARISVDGGNDYDDDPALPAVARVTSRVAQVVERGSLTAAHIASLRALLRDAERLDDVLDGGFSDTIQGVITWLARPRLV
jgi:hypothetical protein